MEKFVYSLDEEIDKKLLGKKGGNLKQLYNMNIPVPNSIIITTNAHEDFRENGRITRELEKQILEYLKTIEIKSGKKIGDINNPLLLSIRESTKTETSKTEALINIGLNDDIAANLAVDEKTAKFIYDTYRKLIMMYAQIVKGKNPSPFEILMEKYKEKRNVKNDYELTAEDLFQITNESKKIYRKITGEKFPKDPDHQLLEAVRTIYKNWKDINVAIVVEEMIFANLNDNSYIGIAFSKDPKTGEDKLTGAFSYQVQEKNDNVKSIDTLLEKDIEVYQKLEEYAKKLETKYQDIIRISFIVENGKLYVLDSKKAKKTTFANLNFIIEKINNEVITKEKAIKMIKPNEIFSLTYDSLSNKKNTPIASAEKAVPEAITGKICLDFENASNEKNILIKEKLVPEDIKYINNIDSIITIENNELNDLVEEMGKIHIKNIQNIKIDLKNRIVKIEDKIFEEGSAITIDGSEGKIYEGTLDIQKPITSANLNKILKIAKEIKTVNIITNEIPIESLTDGIGIFKVENTLFDKEKIHFIRKILLSETAEEKVRVLKDLSVMHIKDLEKLFKISNEKTLTIKLLDIYLREFLPKTNKEIYELSEILKIDVLTLKEKLKSLEKYNSLLDLKGSALALEYPEIIKIEAETIFKAMINVKKDGYNINPEIILPKVNSAEELKYLKELINEVKETILKNSSITYKIGTIIETPRDTVIASSYAKEVDILIFDTEKLTALAYGPEELKKASKEPLDILDKQGVGRLMNVVSSLSYKLNPDIKIGAFGRQNEDEESITFLNKIGVKNLYVLPHQLPVTLIAAARSEINGNR